MPIIQQLITKYLIGDFRMRPINKSKNSKKNKQLELINQPLITKYLLGVRPQQQKITRPEFSDIKNKKQKLLTRYLIGETKTQPKMIKPTLSATQKKNRASGIIPFNRRKEFSEYLFKKNTVSDEYYTRGHTWARFIEAHGLKGKTIFEPFYGDGTSREALAGLVSVVGKAGDFWDNINAPDCPQEYIMTNPPFSFKWLVIQTFLEKRRPFAMIMPWQMFYNSSLAQLDNYAEFYGGRWTQFKLTAQEQKYWSPEKKEMVGIGSSILVWNF